MWEDKSYPKGSSSLPSVIVNHYSTPEGQAYRGGCVTNDLFGATWFQLT